MRDEREIHTVGGSGCRLKDAMLNQVSYQESFKLTLTGFILV